MRGIREHLIRLFRVIFLMDSLTENININIRASAKIFTKIKCRKKPESVNFSNDDTWNRDAKIMNNCYSFSQPVFLNFTSESYYNFQIFEMVACA